MDKKFLIKFAGKNLFSHRLRTILTIMAMVIGVSAIVFLVSFAFGLERLVSKEVTGGNAYEMIDVGTGNSAIIKLNEESVHRLSQISGVKEVERTANAAAKYSISSADSVSDASFFITSAKYIDWLGETIKYGQNLASEDVSGSSDEVVVSEYLALKFSPGDPSGLIGRQINIDVIPPKELRDSSENKIFEKQIYTVTGISNNADSADIYANLGNISKYGIINYSQAKIQVTSSSLVTEVRGKVENFGFKTQYLGETISQVQRVFNFFKLILSGFGFIALVVACLGMFNTLTISLLERTKEVALLKILGAKRKDIIAIFLSEAVVIGILGGILGIVFGLIISSVVNKILNTYAINAGGQTVSAFYSPLWFLLLVFVFTAAVGFLTGIYPARRAARINALNVLRYE